MKILLLYYSGVGNTKMIAKKMYDLLQSSNEVFLESIENQSYNVNSSDFDALVVGFPTIHSSPAKPILDFIEQTKLLPKPIPTFAFTTCGLYSANTLRIFAKQCQKKNIVTVFNKSYRCAAIDGILLAPYIKIWFCHENELDRKIRNDIDAFVALMSEPIKAKVPRFKLYSILNYPNKLLGQNFSPKIYTHKENCILCYKCLKNCPVDSIHKDKSGVPFVDKTKCINCYRCIHHCPKLALSLSKKNTPRKTLYYQQAK